MAMMGLDGGRINIGTCSIGAAQQAFNIAREHVQVSTEIRHLKSTVSLPPTLSGFSLFLFVIGSTQ